MKKCIKTLALMVLSMLLEATHWLNTVQSIKGSEPCLKLTLVWIDVQSFHCIFTKVSINHNEQRSKYC